MCLINPVHFRFYFDSLPLPRNVGAGGDMALSCSRIQPNMAFRFVAEGVPIVVVVGLVFVGLVSVDLVFLGPAFAVPVVDVLARVDGGVHRSPPLLPLRLPLLHRYRLSMIQGVIGTPIHRYQGEEILRLTVGYALLACRKAQIL